MKMVEYITTAHGIAQRLSEKWRHFVCALLSSLFCTSPRCVGVPARDGAQARAPSFSSQSNCRRSAVCASWRCPRDASDGVGDRQDVLLCDPA